MRQTQQLYEKYGTPDNTEKGRRKLKKKFSDDAANDYDNDSSTPKPKKKKNSMQSAKNLVKKISAVEQSTINVTYDDEKNDISAPVGTVKERDSESLDSFPCMMNETPASPLIHTGDKKTEDDELESSNESHNESINSPKIKCYVLSPKDNAENSPKKKADEKSFQSEVHEFVNTIENCQKDNKLETETDYELSQLSKKYHALKEQYQKVNSDLEHYKESMKHNKENENFIAQRITNLEKELYDVLAENRRLKSCIEDRDKDWSSVYTLAKKNITKTKDIVENKSNSVHVEQKKEPFKQWDKQLKQKEEKQHDERNSQVIDNSYDSGEIGKNENKENDKIVNVNEAKDVQKKIIKNVKEEPFVIAKDLTKKCRSNSVSCFTADLLEQVFTLDELSSSSMKGLQSNANIKKGITSVKPALDKRRLKAVQHCVFNKFGKNNDVKSLFLSAARRKLSECSRRLKEDILFKEDVYKDSDEE